MQIRFYKLIITAISTPLILLGCAVPSPSFTDMSQSYQNEMEIFQNNNILLNVVRASKNMPLSFLDIPSVVGTGNFSASAGIGAYLYASGLGTSFFTPVTGSMGSYWNPSANLTANRSFNFTLSSLQNEQFERGFVSKIPIETLNFFTSGLQIPRELLFTLLIEKIEFVKPTGEVVVLNNNPLGNPREFQDFQTQLRLSIDSGLTTEILQTQIPVTPTMTKEEVLFGKNLGDLLKMRDKQMILQETKVGGVSRYQLVQVMPQGRFCFEKTKNIDLVKNYFGNSVLCANPLEGIPPQSLSGRQKVGEKNSDASKILAITLRSTQNVFVYLGSVLAAKDHLNRVVTLKALSNEKSVPLMEIAEEWPLIVANSSSSNSRPLAKVEYDGMEYSIPSENNGYSVGVLNLLTQLVNLLKVPGSIPASPAVLIK